MKYQIREAKLTRILEYNGVHWLNRTKYIIKILKLTNEANADSIKGNYIRISTEKFDIRRSISTRDRKEISTKMTVGAIREDVIKVSQMTSSTCTKCYGYYCSETLFVIRSIHRTKLICDTTETNSWVNSTTVFRNINYWRYSIGT